MWRFLAILGLCATPAWSWTEPSRGSADRIGMMDAIRPHAEWQLGGAVEFVVTTLRADGDLGFGILTPQRSGGGEIDRASTPMALRDPDAIDVMDGLRIDVLYQRAGTTWVALHWAIGATDVWYSDPALCKVFRSVMPEAC